MTTRRDILAGLLALPLAPVSLGKQILPWHSRLIQAARQQIGVTRHYDPAYVRLAYPGGDVARERGVCTDVVIRAYRDAFDLDLQVRLHEDMGAHFAAYPANWGLTRPDKNIDHRRVPNLERYFRRNGAELDVPAHGRDWQAGDLLTMRLNGHLPHIAVVSDKRTKDGVPLVIHNIGSGTREESIIGVYEKERRFRFRAQQIM